MGRLLLVVLVLGSSASVARAQADDLWDRGVALRRQGRDAEALDAFEQAHARERSPRTLAQIALAEQALGRWAAAATHLDTALEAPDAWVSQNRAALEQARGEIERHVGRVDVRVDRAGATVTVDGVDAGTTPLARPVPATPGTVTVRVRGPGGRTAERSAVVAAGGVTPLSIELGDAESSGGGGDALPIAGGVLLGLGGAAAVGMAIAWGVREAHAAEWNSDACWPVGMTREQQCGHVRATALDAEIAAIALGIGAAALLGAGLALVLVGGGQDGDRPGSRAASRDLASRVGGGSDASPLCLSARGRAGGVHGAPSGRRGEHGRRRDVAARRAGRRRGRARREHGRQHTTRRDDAGGRERRRGD